MEKITTPEDLYTWAYEMDGEAGDAVESVMHLMGDKLSGDGWSLCMLHALGADQMLIAQTTEEGIRLKSTPSFERGYKVKLNVTLPHEAFAHLGNLMFNRRKN